MGNIEKCHRNKEMVVSQRQAGWGQSQEGGQRVFLDCVSDLRPSVNRMRWAGEESGWVVRGVVVMFYPDLSFSPEDLMGICLLPAL